VEYILNGPVVYTVKLLTLRNREGIRTVDDPSSTIPEFQFNTTFSLRQLSLQWAQKMDQLIT